MPENPTDFLIGLSGKTVYHMEHTEAPGSSDYLTIRFTDGSVLTVTAQWCNDRTAALDYAVTPPLPLPCTEESKRA